uniref:Uncharacterized protein n=1 Tax=Trichinella nativa TaxID=6335 RepID=A0A0V1KI24_9BILA
MCTMYVPDAFRGQKRAMYSMELDLRMGLYSSSSLSSLPPLMQQDRRVKPEPSVGQVF